ncbi:MAG TPA: VWA domain-containing protein [Pseudonocardiaceae bacterium]|nr:VWA domain-containing protein [Pseudonocardiaceae bacterium]
MADLATLVAGLGAALHHSGLPVGPDRCERFARAVLLLHPTTTTQLIACAQATLATTPEEATLLTTLLTGVSSDSVRELHDSVRELHASVREVSPPDGDGHGDGRDGGQAHVPATASAQERLAHRDFAELSPEELLGLAELMRNLILAMPARRSHRQRADPYGRNVDLRATLRHSRRTGGHPVRLRRRTRRDKPRRLVVLCDISGSMEPYARAMLQLLYCAAGTRAEVFAFATRLTRLTRALATATPRAALERAGRTAPDWSGGTRIGEALRRFNDRYGRRGMARGAVVLVVSDGWDTGDPRLLGRELARLSLVAHRLVWANPRTQSPRYQPLVAGMAAALPHCDAVVSAHNLASLPDLLAALTGTRPASPGVTAALLPGKAISNVPR